MRTIKVETSITLSDDEWKVLETLHTTPQYTEGKPGWWEFRGSRSDDGMCRGGILKEDAAWELEGKGMVKFNEDSWHTTFGLTDFGKEIYQNMK